MRSRCLAERTFGIGIVASSMLRASAVAETGKPTGTTVIVLILRASPVAPMRAPRRFTPRCQSTAEHLSAVA